MNQEYLIVILPDQSETDMLDKLYDTLNGESGYEKTSKLRTVLEDIQTLMCLFNSEIFKEDRLDDAIDAICEILQDYKRLKNETKNGQTNPQD